MSSKETIREQSRIFNISSSTADIMLNSSMNSSGIWTIPNFIKHDEDVQHIYFSVSHAEIPNSFYLLNQYNNVLALTVGINSTVYYTIPVGNYNVNTLLAQMKILLSPSQLTISYDPIVCKYSFYSNYNQFTISAVGSSINRILGLDKVNDTISILSPITGTNTLLCPYVVNFLPTARLNLRSSALQLDNFHANDKSNDVFLSLQNNSIQNAMILYQNNNALKYHIDLDNLSKLDIRITDDSNRNLDFNNSAWFITIRIDYSYYPILKTTNFKEILKKNNGLLLEYLQSLAD